MVVCGIVPPFALSLLWGTSLHASEILLSVLECLNTFPEVHSCIGIGNCQGGNHKIVILPASHNQEKKG
jgi:hypothetical protein